ncbi:hypothetical protein SKAU_G00074360 [Synaphobranchus kaupii]|uniref:Uncharacterized protein n=1 Tax=Synaphobranchus kaupii TaxID=118154 RepID=A0A9Q1G7V6_SYNKA|nr:hypothetical protein SKAU_G00074360 [Synaphobranchus kaupii]
MRESTFPQWLAQRCQVISSALILGWRATALGCGVRDDMLYSFCPIRANSTSLQAPQQTGATPSPPPPGTRVQPCRGVACLPRPAVFRTQESPSSGEQNHP